MAKNKTEYREGPDKYVASWQDGYSRGTKEAFEWCIRTTMEMNEKAKSDDGKKATAFMAELMRKEIDRRQPPPKGGESVDLSPT